MLVFLALLHLYFLGLAVLHSQMSKASIGDAPEAYRSQIIMGILSLSILPWLILTVALLLLNWKIALILFLVEFVFSPVILPGTRWIFESTVIKPMYKRIESKYKE